jgi:hypothetical protein
MNDAPALRIAIPWLHEAVAEARASDALPLLASLRWIVGRGSSARAPTGDWRDWLLAVDAQTPAAFGRWPAGPCLAAASGMAIDSAPAWAVAQPVHLVAGLDHVRLRSLADAMPSDEEAPLLAATLRAHFVGDVFDLVAYRDHAWLVRCAEAIESDTHEPGSLVGRDIHDYLPAGRDGARLRSRMNEIQMVLHEHPVNERRGRARTAPINALWLWGFGRLDAPPGRLEAASRWLLQTDDLWLRTFWQVHGGAERPLADIGERNALVAITQPPATGPALAEVETSLFVRLQRSLQDGALQSVHLHDGARVHVVERGSRWRFWRRPAAPTEL